MSDVDQLAQRPPLTSLTKPQRRVLGTLVEKAITVPESYPLTLKALTTGCNQKNNRDPVTNYSEEDVEDAVTELRELGLAAVVHTESGRTERFRHYLRQRITELSEPQVAILTELLLRGRQPAGDLRSRASRMTPAGTLDSLDQLRYEISGLVERGLVQSDGPLDRRGVEIDHNLYEPHEARKVACRDEPAQPATTALPAAATSSAGNATGSTARPAVAASSTNADAARIAGLETRLATVESALNDLRTEFAAGQEELASATRALRELRDALGA